MTKTPIARSSLLTGDKKPNFEQFVRAITTREPGPVPAGDLFADPETMGTFLGEDIKRFTRVRNMEEGMRVLEKTVTFCTESGWDFVTTQANLGFSGTSFHITENTSTEVKDGKRGWLDDSTGPIGSWDDFENYPWPENPETIHMPSKALSTLVPEGMKIMTLPGGLFEWSSWLMGLVPFSYALADQPDLVDAIIKKVSTIITKGVEEWVDIPNVGGLFVGDDMGFNTATLISPAILREKFLPHLKHIVDLAHSAGKVVVLHSCGNLEAIMADICDTGIDAKHSFQDMIMPVEDAYRKWGDRIGIIGGVDVDLMASATEETVRKRTRDILDVCGPNGHYVLGTGNSVTNYIPINNYIAMLDEGRRWNIDHFGRAY